MRYYSNTAIATTLENSGGVTPTSTQLILGSTTGYPTQFPFTLRLDPDTPNEEIVSVNSGGGSSTSPYSVTRGSDGTTARSHPQFSVVTHGFSARDLKEPQDHIADSWKHVKRPVYSVQAQEPPYNVAGNYVAFTSLQWGAITFTSPPSGIIRVSVGAFIRPIAGQSAWVNFKLTGGKTMFGGIENAFGGKTDVTGSRESIVTGLTPNVSTTITPLWQVTSVSAGNYIDGGSLIVELLP